MFTAERAVFVSPGTLLKNERRFAFCGRSLEVTFPLAALQELETPAGSGASPWIIHYYYLARNGHQDAKEKSHEQKRRDRGLAVVETSWIVLTAST